MLEYLVIIQARLGSNRFPNKVMQTVNGVPMVKRVWQAAKAALAGKKAKVVVAWPERYPDLDENFVLERFIRISEEFPSKWIIRLTSDCPLLTHTDISDSVTKFNLNRLSNPDRLIEYYSNHKDGHDVQIFSRRYMIWNGHQEHVIDDLSTVSTGLSVNTKEDLERVRKVCKTK